MGRPAKTLLELVQDGTFRGRRDSHRLLLGGPDLPWSGFALLQARYRSAGSEPERRAVALEFQHAVELVHEQAAQQAAGPADQLQAELAELGRPGSVQQLLGFFPAYLEHPKGPLRGQPFQLESWQRAFLREFYRRDRQGRRVYRWGLLGLPRGQGKTALAAALGLYELVSRSDAPEIYFAAGSKEQAGIALSFAKSFAEQGPLTEWVRVKSGLTCPATHGSLQVVSSEGSLQHGRAPAVAILDELWAFETRAQIETYTALVTALHKREDAYLLAISTAGYNRFSQLGLIYEQALAWPDVTISRDGCLTVAKDAEHGQLFWWYGAPAQADPDDERILRACNPASFIKLAELRKQRHSAGLNEATFRRLHLNQWVDDRKAWIPADTWASLTDKTTLIPSGAEVYLGIDVALTHDTTALAWAHRLPDGRIIIRCKVWGADKQKAAHEHVAGPAIELEEIEEFILERLAKRFKVLEVAYDPRFFERSAELLEKKGLTMVEFRPASAPMVDAYQRFYQLALSGQLLHNGDKILAAHIAAAAAYPRETGWKISKRSSRQPIDAVVASVLAVARADLDKAPRPQLRFVAW
jgi:phage terminase large subunit-like protein